MSQTHVTRVVASVDLDETGGALASTDTHGDDAPLGAAALALLQDVAGAARAGHAEGVADGDRAAVDVVLLGIDTKLVTAVEALRRKGFVEFASNNILHILS